MTRVRPRCEDCIYNDNYNEDVPCGAKIGEPIEYCFRPKTKQQAIDKEYYKELIDMLIDELQTSRAYHLGITGLDSDAEIARKEREGDTALIRGIDRTISYVRKAMEE